MMEAHWLCSLRNLNCVLSVLFNSVCPGHSTQTICVSAFSSAKQLKFSFWHHAEPRGNACHNMTNIACSENGACQ